MKSPKSKASPMSEPLERATAAPDETEQRREHIATAALVFALVVPLTYSLQRAYEYLRGEHGDPRLVLMTLHTVYYWRVGIAFWWGVCVAALVYLWLSRRSAATEAPGVPATRHAERLLRGAWLVVPLNIALSYFMP